MLLPNRSFLAQAETDLSVETKNIDLVKMYHFSIIAS